MCGGGGWPRDYDRSICLRIDRICNARRLESPVATGSHANNSPGRSDSVDFASVRRRNGSEFCFRRTANFAQPEIDSARLALVVSKRDETRVLIEAQYSTNWRTTGGRPDYRIEFLENVGACGTACAGQAQRDRIRSASSCRGTRAFRRLPVATTRGDGKR